MKKASLKKTMITAVAMVLIAALALAGCAPAAGTITTSQQAQTAQDPAPAAAQPGGTADAPADAPASSLQYITLDINPSIQLTVDQGAVIAVQALNDDGDAIVLAADVLGMNPADAVDAIVAELITAGYITGADDATLVITVSGSENGGLAAGLEERARERIRIMDLECEVISAAVSGDEAAAARALGISTARYMLIDYLATSEGISFEEAFALYGDLKVSELLALTGGSEVLTNGDLDELLAQLTPEQSEAFLAALDAYKAAVKDAQSAFIQAGKDVQKYMQDEKQAAQNAYQESRDMDTWQQTKTAAKTAFYEEKDLAKQEAQDARDAAYEAFVATVSALGISDEVLQALLDSVCDLQLLSYDYNWNYDWNYLWSEDEPGAAGQGSENAPGGSDDHGPHADDDDESDGDE